MVVMVVLRETDRTVADGEVFFLREGIDDGVRSEESLVE